MMFSRTTATAAAAEAAGVDLRVMLMTRSVAEVLHVTGEAHGSDRVCLMQRSCAALLRQASAIDARFLFCFPYGERLPAGAGAWLGSDDATLQRVVDAVFEPDDKRRPVTAEEARRSSPDCFRALANCSRRLEALCDDQGR